MLWTHHFCQEKLINASTTEFSTANTLHDNTVWTQFQHEMSDVRRRSLDADLLIFLDSFLCNRGKSLQHSPALLRVDHDGD